MKNNLQETLTFNSEDLHLNKAGLLSPSQQKVLETKYRRKEKVTFRLFIFSMLCLLFILILVLNSRSSVNEPISLQYLVIVTGLLSLPSAILLTLYFIIYKKRKDTLKGKIAIKSQSGQAQLIQAALDFKTALFMRLMGGEDSLFILKLDGKNFHVDRETFKAFKNGQRYTIYYTIVSGETIVISAEAM